MMDQNHENDDLIANKAGLKAPLRVTKSDQGQKVEQMQPMWVYILSYGPFEATFENAQQRKFI